MLKVKTDLLDAFNQKKAVCLLLLDLSMAFDTMNHEYLLNCLKYMFGVDGTVLAWLTDYLTDQTQRVVLDGEQGQIQSDSVTLKCGVPQGSVLGPILFTLYISPLGDICWKHGTGISHLCQLPAGISKFCTSNRGGQRNMPYQSAKIAYRILDSGWRLTSWNWMTVRWEFIMVGSKQNLLKTDAKNTVVQIRNDSITCVDTVWDLGFIIENEFKSTAHISKLSSILFVTIRKIARIRHLIDEEMTKTLIQALFLSKLDYCNSLLIGTSEYNLEKLQRIQNMSCQVINNLKKYDNITNHLQDLHWLKI